MPIVVEPTDVDPIPSNVTYCTIADVRLALVAGGIMADNSTAASLSDSQISDSIREAGSMVETYVASQFDWDRTLSPAPDPMRWLTRDIAAYLATLVYRKGKDLPETDPIVRRYNHALRVLVDISTGRVTIVDPDAPADATGEPEAYNLYNGRLFDPADVLVERTVFTHQPSLWPGY